MQIARYFFSAVVFTLILLGSTSGFTQKKTVFFEIKSLESHLKVPNEQLRVFEDKTKAYNLEDLRSPKASRKFKTLQKRQNLDPFKVYWLKVPIRSSLEQDSEWMLSLGKITNAVVYVEYPQSQKIQKQATGQFVPNEQRAVKGGVYNNINHVPLHLPANAKINVYIRLQNQVNYPTDPNFKLQSRSSWLEALVTNNFNQGIFQGLLAMMFLYNLFLFIKLRDRAYLYYVLYILFTSLYFFNFYGYWGEFVLGEFPAFNYLYMPFVMYLGFFFYLHFMHAYLELEGNWKRLIQGIALVFLLITIALAVLVGLDYSQYMLAEKYLNLGIQGLMVIILLVILIVGDNVARYFAIGTLFMVLGGMSLMLGALKIIYLSSNLFYYQTGIVLQVLMFSLGLSERFKASETAKRETQNQLIAQLEENQRLQTKVNRELEEKVQERTAEIAYQKEEIEAQRDEIEAQRDDIFEKKGLLEKQHEHIQDSINYGSRIQRAIMDDPEDIARRFKDAFIMLLPKDVVSGDFYWYREVEALSSIYTESLTVPASVSLGIQDQPERETQAVLSRLKILVAADCTGHGVPGAFMTVLGSSILDDVVNQSQMIEPHQILEALDRKITAHLRMQGSEIHLQDGMDISVMIYDEGHRLLKFAGAKNPLYYVRDYEIHQLSASPSSIGHSPYTKEKNFTTHLLEVQEDDVFYMASDGYQDQFGGERGRKFMKKRFRELLLNISHLPMARQKERLEESLAQWRQDHTQTDDVLVVGVKLR